MTDLRLAEARLATLDRVEARIYALPEGRRDEALLAALRDARAQIRRALRRACS